MGDCREVFARLSEYLDHELPDGTCDEIRAHIESCPPCVEFIEGVKQAIELCRECRNSELPDPLPEETRRLLLDVYRKVMAAPAG